MLYRNTIAARLFSLVLMLSILFSCAVQAAHAESPIIIRILDGRITTEDLWNAFDNGSSTTGFLGNKSYTHYRYRKADKTTGWKRVNGDSLSSTVYAENIVSGVPYTVLMSREMLTDIWKPHNTYQFQTYYNIGVTKEFFPAGGNVQISGGILSGGVYQVNENDNLTLRFTPVAGYDAQVQVNGTAWVTVDPSTNTYLHKALYSTSLRVRYTASDPSKHRLTIRVNDPRLGIYSGIANDQMNPGSSFRLVVTPYNEMTSANDQDAYVKSVRINNVEVSGTYANTVLTLPAYTVTGNTTIDIEFAKRLILKEPTVSIQKYPEDPHTLEYSAKMNMDKAVSKQITAIEDSILDSVVDTEKTAGYDRSTTKVLVQGVINAIFTSYEGCMEMSKSVFDLPGLNVGALENIINYITSTNWGDISFANGNEEWENIRITMSGSDRYPAVESQMLTVVISEARTVLTISGSTDAQTVESQSNIDATIKSAVNAKIIADNPGITAAQLNASGITYQYTAPAFTTLSSTDAKNIAVQVTIPKGDLCLQSAGTVTVPLKRNAAQPSLTVGSDGNGSISYTRDGLSHTITVTPDAGYYVRQLVVTTTPVNGSASESTVTLDQMTALKDAGFTYTYLLQAALDHSYHVQASFVKYDLTIAPDEFTLHYYDGLYATDEALTAALHNEIQWQITPNGTLPQGTAAYEYLARTEPDVWLPIGTIITDADDTQSPHYGCRAFGTQENETIRKRYTFAADGFSVISNPAAVQLLDERLQTVIKLNNPDPIEYDDYLKMSADEVIALLFDGVYVIDSSSQQTLLPGVMPVFSPAPDKLSSGTTTTITATYAGTAAHKGSTASTTLTINAIPANVSIALSQKVIQHGESYDVSVSTEPAGLRTIQFIAGLDLAKMDLKNIGNQTMMLELALLAPDDLADNLEDFIRSADDDNQLTLNDLDYAFGQLKANKDLCDQYNISASAIESLQQVISMYGSFAANAPLNISTEKPSDTGIYICGAIIAEGDYQSGVALDYLLIAPNHEQIELGWKNEITGPVSLNELSTAGLLDAKVISVAEGGSLADAQSEVFSVFLGFDKDFSEFIVTSNQEELVEGAYTQIACTANMTNHRYSCQPIVREIIVAEQLVHVEFLDADGNPISELIAQRGIEHGAKLRVTYSDGTPVPQEKLDQNLQVLYFFFESIEPRPVDTVSAPGLYIAHAVYMEQSADGRLVAAGNDSMFLLFSEAVDGFTVSDNTVEYDGNGHFVTVTDTNSPALTTTSVIVDKAEKQINILLPESADTLEEIFDSWREGQFGSFLQYLEYYSSENTVIQFFRELLQQAVADIDDAIGYTVTFNGDLPSEPGEYYAYVSAADTSAGSSSGETPATGTTQRALLTITASKPVIQLQYAQDPSKVYDSTPLASPVKGVDYTITGAYKGTETITWYRQTADGLVAVASPVDTGTYTVTVSLAATAWNEAAAASVSDIVIAPKDIADAVITLGDALTYNGQMQTQTIASVTLDGLPVTYTVSGNTATDAGDYVLTVNGTGNFTGSATKAYAVAKKDIADAVITLGDALTYNGQMQTQTIASVTADGLPVTYTVSGNTATDAGDYVLTVNGTGNFTGSATKAYAVAQKNIADAVITLEYTSVLYDGTAKEPAVVSVTADDIGLLENTDFTAEYADNTNPGAARVILTGKNNYTGTASATFVIHKEDEYTVIVTGGQGSGSYKAGDAVTITAEIPNGCEFIRWNGIEGLQFTHGGSLTPAATFSMPARHVTIAAEYEMIPQQTFTVRFSAGTGSGYMADVTGIAGEYQLPACAFTAPAGQQFSAWRIGSTDYTPGDIITVTADTLVTAVWKQTPQPGSAPVIVFPTETQTITLSLGEQTKLSVIADNAQSYQWYADRGNGPVPVSGAAAAAYTTLPAVMDDDGCTYFCVVSNKYGSVRSAFFKLSVQPEIVIPPTGDDAPVELWCALLLGALIGCVLLRRRTGSMH